MTKEQIKYIKENRLKLSIRGIARNINRSYNHTNTFMKKNNLKPTEAEKDHIHLQKTYVVPYSNSKAYWCRNWLIG